MDDEPYFECPRCGESKGRPMLSVFFGILCAKCGFFWFAPDDPLLGDDPDVADYADWSPIGHTVH